MHHSPTPHRSHRYSALDLHADRRPRRWHRRARRAAQVASANGAGQ